MSKRTYDEYEIDCAETLLNLKKQKKEDNSIFTSRALVCFIKTINVDYYKFSIPFQMLIDKLKYLEFVERVDKEATKKIIFEKLTSILQFSGLIYQDNKEIQVNRTELNFSTKILLDHFIKLEIKFNKKKKNKEYIYVNKKTNKTIELFYIEWFIYLLNLIIEYVKIYKMHINFEQCRLLNLILNTIKLYEITIEEILK
jgi:hypothetical protein